VGTFAAASPAHSAADEVKILMSLRSKAVAAVQHNAEVEVWAMHALLKSGGAVRDAFATVKQPFAEVERRLGHGIRNLDAGRLSGRWFALGKKRCECFS